MAIAHVQSNKVYGTGNSLGLAFGSDVAAGALIVVAIVRYAGGPVSTVTDTRGNTYNRCVAEQTYSGDSSAVQDTWYAYNSGAGANTVTVSGQGASAGISLAIHEYSGALTTDPLDRTAQAQFSNGANPVSSGNTATTAQADEMLFGQFYGYWASSQTITADTGAGFTLRQTYGNGATQNPIGTEDRNVAATGTYAATFNRTNTQPGMVRVVTFKAAAGGGGGTAVKDIIGAGLIAFPR